MAGIGVIFLAGAVVLGLSVRAGSEVLNGWEYIGPIFSVSCAVAGVVLLVIAAVSSS